MKKNKILPVCLLLLTSFGLVGCGDNTSSSSNSTSVDSEYIQRITLKSTADKVVTIGQEVSIDDYINLLGKDSAKITPSDTNYTISITSGDTLGSLSGHKFTPSREGTIRFSITSAADDSIKASLELTAVSSLKKKFVNDTQDITDKFTLEALSADESGNLIIDDYGYVGDQTGSIHSTNFFAVSSSDGLYGYLAGSDSETYYFTCSDRFGSNLKVSPGPTGSELSNYYLAADFTISALNDATTSVDEDGNDILILTNDATTNYIQYGLGYSTSRIQSYGYTIEPAQVDYQPVTFYDMNGEKVQKEMPVIYTFISLTTTSGTQTGLLNASILEYGDNYGLKGIDEYIKTIGTPDPIKDPGVNNVVDAINKGQNFTKQEEFGWYKASLDENGESFETFVPCDVPESMSADLSSFFPVSSTPSVSRLIATKDKVKEEFVSGYGNLTPTASEGEEVTNGYNVYSLNREDSTKVDEKTNITTVDSTLKLGDEVTTSSALGKATSVYSYVSATKGLEGVSFSSNYIADVTTSSDDGKEITKVVLNSGKYAESFLGGLIDNSSYNRLGLLYSWSAKVWGTSLADASSTISMLSDVNIQYVKEGDAYTELTVSACLVWQLNSDSTYTVVRWAFNFTDIGTTYIIE